MCIILFNPKNDSISIRIAILSCGHVTVQCIIDTYRVIRTMSISDGGEIVYNFNIKVIASVSCRVNNVIRNGRSACGRPLPTSPHNI